jgi:uncharacterized protein
MSSRPGNHGGDQRVMMSGGPWCRRRIRGSAGVEARRLADITLNHLREGAVALVLIGGLPGTGKSALADAVASRLGATVLSSDRIRKELAGLPPSKLPAMPYRTGIYVPAVTEATYAELLRRASSLLARGELVIADASWASAKHRAAAAAAAHSADARLIQLRCAAPADLAAQRLTNRIPGASDADRAIAQQMSADMAPWPEAITIDTHPGSHDNDAGQTNGTGQTSETGDLIDRAVTAVRPPRPESAWHPARPYMAPG